MDPGDEEVPSTPVQSQVTTVAADNESQPASQVLDSAPASDARGDSPSQNGSHGSAGSGLELIGYEGNHDGFTETIWMWVTQEGEMSQSPNVVLQDVQYANGSQGIGLKLLSGMKRGEVVGPGIAWVACGGQQYVATKYEKQHQRSVSHGTAVWKAAVEAYVGEQVSRSRSEAVEVSWLDLARKDATCVVMGFGVVQPRGADMLLDRTETNGKVLGASFVDEAAKRDDINCMWDTRLNAYIALRDVEEDEWAYTTYGRDPNFQRTWEIDDDFGDTACGTYKWESLKKVIGDCLNSRHAMFFAAVKSLRGVLVNTAEKKSEVFCLLAACMDSEVVTQALFAALGPKESLVQNEHEETKRRRAEREMNVHYRWNAEARESIDTKGQKLSAYEATLMSFCDDTVLHATGVMAHPVVRSMLAKGLQACTSVEEEEDVLHHYKAVVGLLSRMCVPRFQYDTDDTGVTVSDWMVASVPEHVRRMEPKGREKTSREKCAVLEGALRAASHPAVGAGRKVVIAWTCALYAGVLHASWLMETGIYRANAEDIYPDAMVAAIPFLPYHCSYKSLFDAMEKKGISNPGLMLGVKGDSQFINTVESMLYARGIVASNGKDGTIAPWARILNWMIVGGGDWDWRLDKKWQKLITKKLEEEVKSQYCRSGADDEEMASSGRGWITKVLEPNSKELGDTMFFGNTGPRLDQRIKMFNVQHLKSLYDVVAKGATHARAHTCKYSRNTMPLPPELGRRQAEMSPVPLMYLRALERYMSAGARVARPHVDVDNTKDLFKDKTGFFAAVELVMMGVKPTTASVHRYQEVARLSAQAGRSEDGLTYLQVRAKNSASLLVDFNNLEEREQMAQVERSRQVKVKGVAYRYRRDYLHGSKRRSVRKVARYSGSSLPRMPCQLSTTSHADQTGREGGGGGGG